MIIGVDAGMLGITDDRLKVGVWRVVVELLQALSRCNDYDAYRLYSFAAIPADLMHTLGFRFENRVLTPTKGWMTLRLPIELRLHPVDVFLGVAQALPNAPGRKIGFIYDLGFLSYPEFYPGSVQKLTRQTRELVDRADAVVTISRAVGDDIARVFGVPEHKLAVAYPGVGAQFTSKGTHHTSPRPYFFYAGSLKRGKNVATLVRAFGTFLGYSHTEYDLYLAGSDYWPDPDLETAIATTGLSHRVRRLGFVTDDELAAYYRGAVAFVSPSHVEGFCLPAVEAMACGCPVIASDIPALTEIVGDAGVLTGPYDVEAIAQALQMIATDEKTRKALILKGKKRALNFRWKTMAKTVYSLL